MTKPWFNVIDFEGTVIAMDWVNFVDGSLYKGFTGRLTIVSAEEAVGWTPTGHNSANWFVRIQGPTASITLMGCQVRAVVEGIAPTTRDFLVLP